MTARTALLQVSALRTAYGLGSIFAPEAMAKAAGMPLDPDARYFNAIFGGRDLTVVAAVLTALRAGRTREAAWINASCELTDLVSLVLEHRRRGGADGLLKAAAGFSAVGQLLAIRALLAR